MNRRGILGFLAASPLAGKAVADSVIADLSNAPGNPAIAPSTGYGVASQAQEMKPLIQRSHALRMVRGSAEAVAEVRAEIMEQQRHVTAVDPDIMVMKSWSPMAKITFQRQRNVDRALAELFGDGEGMRNFYSAALNRWMDKFMWGRS